MTTSTCVPAGSGGVTNVSVPSFKTSAEGRGRRRWSTVTGVPAGPKPSPAMVTRTPPDARPECGVHVMSSTGVIDSVTTTGALCRCRRSAIGEAVGPVVIGRWRIGEAAVGLQRQSAVRGPRHQHRGQRLAVDIGVVRQHTGTWHDEGHVFARRKRVGGRGRRVVRARDDEGDRRTGLCAVPSDARYVKLSGPA